MANSSAKLIFLGVVGFVILCAVLLIQQLASFDLKLPTISNIFPTSTPTPFPTTRPLPTTTPLRPTATSIPTKLPTRRPSPRPTFQPQVFPTPTIDPWLTEFWRQWEDNNQKNQDAQNAIDQFCQDHPDLCD